MKNRKKIIIATLIIALSFVVLGSAYLVYQQVSFRRSEAGTKTTSCDEVQFVIPFGSSNPIPTSSSEPRPQITPSPAPSSSERTIPSTPPGPAVTHAPSLNQ